MPMFISLIWDSIRMRWGKLVAQILFNIVFTLLVFRVLFTNLGALIPQIQFYDAHAFFLPGFLVFLTAVLGFAIASIQFRDSLYVNGTMDQIRSTHLRFWQIYFAKITAYIIKTILHVLLSGILVLILTQSGVKAGFFILFVIYLLFIAAIAVQFGAFVGTFVHDQEIYFLLLNFIIIPLFLCSGVIIPIQSTPKIIADIFTWLPTTILVNAGRDLLLNESFNWPCMSYALGLVIFAFLFNFLLIRRKLSR